MPLQRAFLGMRVLVLTGAGVSAESGIPTLLDTYGVTDPVEFFAVSVEAFFERPCALRAYHPNLYAQLQKYFRQDPVEYPAEPAGWY